ncbi:nickel-responsive regulator 1 [Candidatus Pacearchaeota archaeon]|nr:nickel-responsive regulator 1 [Candidatus Pacearchaeota archaeon]
MDSSIASKLFKGRSEAVRNGLHHIFAEEKQKRLLKGNIDAVLLVLHDARHTQNIASITHRYQSMIRTQLHNHKPDSKCLELFMLNGEASLVKKMVAELQFKKFCKYVKLITY